MGRGGGEGGGGGRAIISTGGKSRISKVFPVGRHANQSSTWNGIL